MSNKLAGPKGHMKIRKARKSREHSILSSNLKFSKYSILNVNSEKIKILLLSLSNRRNIELNYNFRGKLISIYWIKVVKHFP